MYTLTNNRQMMDNRQKSDLQLDLDLAKLPFSSTNSWTNALPPSPAYLQTIQWIKTRILIQFLTIAVY